MILKSVSLKQKKDQNDVMLLEGIILEECMECGRFYPSDLKIALPIGIGSSWPIGGMFGFVDELERLLQVLEKHASEPMQDCPSCVNRVISVPVKENNLCHVCSQPHWMVHAAWCSAGFLGGIWKRAK